jgi:hypothetical protein
MPEGPAAAVLRAETLNAATSNTRRKVSGGPLHCGLSIEFSNGNVFPNVLLLSGNEWTVNHNVSTFALETTAVQNPNNVIANVIN